MAIVRNTKRDDAVPRAVLPQNCNQTYYTDVRKIKSYTDRGSRTKAWQFILLVILPAMTWEVRRIR